jgi:hypothetical protein
MGKQNNNVGDTNGNFIESKYQKFETSELLQYNTGWNTNDGATNVFLAAASTPVESESTSETN